MTTIAQSRAAAGMMGSSYGSNRKYTDEQRDEIVRLNMVQGLNSSQIEKLIGVKESTVRKILNECSDAPKEAKPIKAAQFSGWDFSQDNLPPERARA